MSRFPNTHFARTRAANVSISFLGRFDGIENERGTADLEGDTQRRGQISQCPYVSLLSGVCVCDPVKSEKVTAASTLSEQNRKRGSTNRLDFLRFCSECEIFYSESVKFSFLSTKPSARFFDPSDSGVFHNFSIPIQKFETQKKNFFILNQIFLKFDDLYEM